jgi:hypothetical protein
MDKILKRFRRFLIMIGVWLSISVAHAQVLPPIPNPGIPNVIISLTWDASTSQGVTGYRMHWGSVPGGNSYTIDVGNVTRYDFKVIQYGPQYFFVTAYSPLEESSPSETLVVTVWPNGDQPEIIAGPIGDPGPQGPVGPPGERGDGLTAYEIAVQNGFIGTEKEWLVSLIGPPGPKGDSGTGGTVTQPASPAITWHAVTAIGTTTATIAWQTDVECSGFVLWGTVESSLQAKTSNNQGTVDHLVNLTGLTSRTRYVYKLQSVCGVVTVESPIYSFNTKVP